MPVLVTNLQDIPDKVPLLDAGEYHGDILSVTLQPPKGEQKERYEVQFSISEGPQKGKRISDNFSTIFLSDPNHFISVRFKDLCKSIGLGDKSEVATEDMVGRNAWFTVKHSPGKDKENNATEYANVGKYLFPKTQA